MRNIQPGKDKAVLSVPVSRLVEVHEIHVDLVIGELFICLCMQMQKGLPEKLQAFDPHLGRGEGVHPGNDAYTVVIIHDPSHILHTDPGSLHGGQQLDGNGILQPAVQKIHDLGAVSSDLLQAFLSIQILAAGNKVQLAHSSRILLVYWKNRCPFGYLYCTNSVCFRQPVNYNFGKDV